VIVIARLGAPPYKQKSLGTDRNGASPATRTKIKLEPTIKPRPWPAKAPAFGLQPFGPNGEPLGPNGEAARVAGLQEAASYPPGNGVISLEPWGYSDDSASSAKACGFKACGLQYSGLNIAALRSGSVAECAYREGSRCRIDPKCHIDNV
jgi:hypothetical protein